MSRKHSTILYSGSANDAAAPRAQRSRSVALVMAIVAAFVVGIVGSSGGPFVPSASAIEGYPSWDDVQRAKTNEASAAAEVTRIEGLINQLAANVTATQAEADLRSDEYFTAREAAFAAAERADSLQTQADAQAAVASDASVRAARVAAQLYRDGGEQASMDVFFSGSADGAEDLLSRLGRMDKLVERNRAVYDGAVTAQGSAQLLTDQANVARTERDRLQVEAEQKMIESQEAADAAQAALEAQTAHRVELEAQLAALKDTTAQTVAGYQAGVEAERQARLERERIAAEQARQAAIALAAAAAAANQNSGGGTVAPSSGWARPSAGRHTSDFGLRGTICVEGSGCTTGHRGVDLATGCGAGIFAASAGRVIYSARYGQHGNHIEIDHGGGIVTAYSHIQNGGLLVRVGQTVSAGQLIAREGDTGLSQGCHLHFEVHNGGTPINPTPFMAARGISV